MFFEAMHPSWQAALAGQRELLEQIEAAAVGDETTVPAPALVMRAFEQPLAEVRVLLVGQDPYPTPGHAIGLSFAVAPEVRPLPRSLQNMMRELRDDLGGGTLFDGGATNLTTDGDLARWASQGVMLLNRHLTTSSGSAGGHFDIGWLAFTDEVIKVLNRARGNKLVAILWGSQAQSLRPLLADAQVIESAHPSPLSARKGFFGSKPFSKANSALTYVGEQPINWSC
ncbi:MAG: uracil-DNA glycosylase [Micrococcales bacterium]